MAGGSSYWDWLPQELQERVLGLRAASARYAPCRPYGDWHFFHWWLCTVPLDGFSDMERAVLQEQGVSERGIRTRMRKRGNQRQRASTLYHAVMDRYYSATTKYSNFEVNLLVWYDPAFRKSVHNCIYCFELHPQQRSLEPQAVLAGRCVEALRAALPPAVFARSVRVRVAGDRVRFYFLGRDADPFVIDYLPHVAYESD